MKDRVFYSQDFRGQPLSIHLWPEKTPGQIGQFAMELVRSWGLVVGKASEEDSAGRSVMAVMPIEEVVGRACDLAEGTFAELGKRGLLVEIADREAARDQVREERDRN